MLCEIPAEISQYKYSYRIYRIKTQRINSPFTKAIDHPVHERCLKSTRPWLTDISYDTRNQWIDQDWSLHLRNCYFSTSSRGEARFYRSVIENWRNIEPCPVMYRLKNQYLSLVVDEWRPYILYQSIQQASDYVLWFSYVWSTHMFCNSSFGLCFVSLIPTSSLIYALLIILLLFGNNDESLFWCGFSRKRLNSVFT